MQRKIKNATEVTEKRSLLLFLRMKEPIEAENLVCSKTFEEVFTSKKDTIGAIKKIVNINI